MEDFGDWLYLIIIIIAGVSSIISSARKKARQTAEQKQPRREVTNSNPEEDFWNEKASPQQQLPKKEPVTTIKPKLQPSLSYQSVTTQKKHYFDIQQEGQPSLTSENTEFMSAETDQEEVSITLEELPSNIEEWRKAFVYNEIFNRKY